MIRELHEELGIETVLRAWRRSTFASHAQDDFHLLMPLFARRRWQGILGIRAEGQKLAWHGPKNWAPSSMSPGGHSADLALCDWL